MTEDLLELTATVVAAYVAHNAVQAAGLPALIADVSAALGKLSAPSAPEPALLVPAANPKKSVFPEYIISLEDGKKFKSLKRHLMTSHGMTPDQYRAKWDLPRDYPMVAPAYAERRSALAKASGLGRKAAEPVVTAPAKAMGKPKVVATAAKKPVQKAKAAASAPKERTKRP